jgi:hypothetical protein
VASELSIGAVDLVSMRKKGFRYGDGPCEERTFKSKLLEEREGEELRRVSKPNANQLDTASGN